ncbi:MAG TPA: bifunctional riboflavin kinase/FAD synthetase [Deltaproteobacteria bacterium]|nr:bifunctional riboflavin kinase/FAD synthetase [Deltaproteobacteria bacterium]
MNFKIYHSSKSLPASLEKPVFALGNFDGVHLAHQRMFQMAIAAARKIGGLAAAYTFEPHPVKVLSPASAPKMINTLTQRLELMKKSGLNAVVVEPFNRKFAQLGAEEWFRKIVLGRLRAAGLVVGYDFTFGSHRSGTTETLLQLCRDSGLNCRVLEATLLGETLISSSQIRSFVAQGEVKQAGQLLGRPFFIDGRVIQGVGRGAELGIRTANLQTENELIPLSGVYACRAEIAGRHYPAVTNIGMNPTFGGTTLSIEAHLLRFKRDIYDRNLRLHFIERIREERTFASAGDLVVQIHHDIRETERILFS